MSVLDPTLALILKAHSFSVFLYKLTESGNVWNLVEMSPGLQKFGKTRVENWEEGR